MENPLVQFELLVFWGLFGFVIYLFLERMFNE